MTITFTEAVLVSVISGIFLVTNTLVTKRYERSTRSAIDKSSNDTISAVEQRLQIAQAVTDTKLDDLTREVRRHNGFAEKIPKIQGDIRLISEQIKVANHRIDDLEHTV